MTIETRNRWFTRVGTAAIAAVALGALAVPLTPANAQYLGIDLGGGVGQTIGFIEGREAAWPFDEPTPVDAIDAALVDEIFYRPLNA